MRSICMSSAFHRGLSVEPPGTDDFTVDCGTTEDVDCTSSRTSSILCNAAYIITIFTRSQGNARTARTHFYAVPRELNSVRRQVIGSLVLSSVRPSGKEMYDDVPQTKGANFCTYMHVDKLPSPASFHTNPQRS